MRHHLVQQLTAPPTVDVWLWALPKRDRQVLGVYTHAAILPAEAGSTLTWAEAYRGVVSLGSLGIEVAARL